MSRATTHSSWRQLAIIPNTCSPDNGIVLRNDMWWGNLFVIRSRPFLMNRAQRLQQWPNLFQEALIPPAANHNYCVESSPTLFHPIHSQTVYSTNSSHVALRNLARLATFLSRAPLCLALAIYG